MSLSIRTNVASLNAQRNLVTTQNALDSSLSRLSSGFRITRAGDDAAGLGISTKLESQIRSYSQATRNANDGLSVVQASESALNEQASILTRLRELAMQSSSDGIGDAERAYVDQEAQALLDEMERISQVTEYNGAKLLNGTNASGLDFQVGIGASANDVITIKPVNVTTASGSPTGAAATAGAFQAGAGAYATYLTANPGDLFGARQAADAAVLGLSGVPNVAEVMHEMSFNLEDIRRIGGAALVAATANGGTGGSAVLQAAYGAFGARVALDGDADQAFVDAFNAASAVDPANSVSAADAAMTLFRAYYDGVQGGLLLGGPVVPGSAATLAGLAGLAGTGASAGGSGGGLGVSSLSLAAKGSALSALGTIDSAIATLSSARAELGASGNRLQSAIANIQAFSESLSAANSRIKDVDVAEETSRMARSQILSQAGVSVLAQANQMPQLALKLLG